MTHYSDTTDNILKKNTDARSDDGVLFDLFLREYKYILIKLPGATVSKYEILNKLNSVSRRRRKLQEQGKYPAKQTTQYIRAILEEEYIRTRGDVEV